MMDPPTQLQELHLEASRVTDESLESTRKMVTLCEESQEIGIKTLVMLDEQGEQLDRVEEGMDRINADMREAERHLTGMEKCCGLCVCPCYRNKRFKKTSDYEKTWKSSEDGRVVNSQPTRVLDNRNGAPPPPGGYVSRITNDAREDEMDENLVQVNSMLGNLRNMALDMGTELDSQNDQAERICRKADSNEDRIKLANARTEKIIKKS